MDVLIYGATGFTGTLVAHELRARGVDFGIVGRNGDKLEALAGELGGDIVAREAQLHHPEALREALGDARVVVGCAGPFTRFGEPVVRAAMHGGAHYLDTTGEQSFMRDIYERYDSTTRKRGLCFVNGLAFEIALGDWAAALAGAALGADREPLDEIAIAYALEHMHPTRGTMLSALAAAQQPGYAWRRDRWDPTAPASETRTFGFPPPFGDRQAVSFPSGEIISVPRHQQTHRVQTYFALPTGAASLLVPRLGRLASVAARSPLGGFLRRRVEQAPPAPTQEQRARTGFAITALARRGFDSSYLCVTGNDVYATTARIVALGVTELLTRGPRAVGVCAPAEAFDARASLAALGLHLDASFELS